MVNLNKTEEKTQKMEIDNKKPIVSLRKEGNYNQLNNIEPRMKESKVLTESNINQKGSKTKIFENMDSGSVKRNNNESTSPQKNDSIQYSEKNEREISKNKIINRLLLIIIIMLIFIFALTILLLKNTKSNIYSGLGDANEDGIVDMVDASIILSIYTNSSTDDTYFISKSMNTNLDVNGDGTIDGVDASIVSAYYAYYSVNDTISESLEEYINENY